VLGLALEGGGAKGAYHIGVVKALLEEGYQFGGITGTSIGALNGAVIAQGDFEKVYELWENLDFSHVFDIDDLHYKKLKKMNIDKGTLVELAAKAKKVIERGGLDTSKMQKIIESIIDEEKLRKSEVDFGLVTVSFPDLKPVEIYKEDIPEGKIVDYLLASANLPVFEPKKIEDKYYIDGGFYDNCPINLLAEKGYKEIIAVRTLGVGIVKSIKYPDVQVIDITPSENLGGILEFDRNIIQLNLKMGYYDAMRHIKKLAGSRYYFYKENMNEDMIFHRLLSIPDERICSLGKLFGIKEMPPKRMLFEKIMPKVVHMLGLEATATYEDIVLSLLEFIAGEEEIDKYQVRYIDDFIKTIKESLITGNNGKYEEQPKIPGLYTKKYKLLKVAKEICDSACFD